ncbi:MAG: hypothetical protein WBG50_12800 [Desulfomonilaceae bacterium]
MNTSQSSPEKRTIKVKDFLEDFHAGISDGELLKRYHLTPAGLEKFYSMLLERHIIETQELQAHDRRDNLRGAEALQQDEEKARFICPSCLVGHDTMFDICPTCGVSFQELMNRERRIEGAIPDIRRASSVEREMGSDPKARVICSGGGQEHMLSDCLPLSPENEHATEPEQESDKVFFTRVDSPSGSRPTFDEPLDEIVQGSPFDYPGEDPDNGRSIEVLCDSCQETMQTGLRDVYDRGRSYLAIKMSAASLILGLLGCLMVSFFDGYSLGRLIVVWATAIFFLAGASLFTVGSFMFLAREKVYLCPICRRIYPKE